MTTVVGLFETRDGVDRAIEALRSAGFRAEDLGVVAREPSLAGDVAADIEADRGRTAAVLGGGMIGGVAGLLAGLGAMAIPGLGLVLAVGPIAAALAGTAVGATAGGMIGALTSHGVPAEEADYYTQALERGAILLTVQTTEDRADEARRLLAEHGSDDAEARAVANSAESDRAAPSLTTRAVEEAAGSPGVGVGSVAGFALGDGGPSLHYHHAEPRFRAHWEATRPGPGSYDDVRHAYRYGWESYEDPDDFGKSWEEISDRLASGWAGVGDWHEHAPMVREAWEARGRR